MVDEVRVSSVARDSNWLKLCYQNQRPDGDRLVAYAGGACDAASVVSHTGDTTVEEHHVATLNVVARGTNRRYQWYRDGSPIAGATAGTHSFVAQLSDNGAGYRCEVTVDCDGSLAGTDAIVVTVTERCVPPGIVDTLHDRNLDAGDSLRLTVQDTGSNCRYRWYRDNQFLGNDTTIKAFSVESASGDDGGIYHVVVYNSCGSDTSRRAAVSVCVPPDITTQPLSRGVMENDVVVFSIAAQGSGLSYQWQCDSSGGAGQWFDVPGTTASYSLLTPLSYDGNRYRCEVRNDCGVVMSAVCTLTVSADCLPLAITEHPRDTNVVENSRVTLRAAASGAGLYYRWLRGSSPAPGDSATGAVYSFIARRQDDGVAYRCAVVSACDGTVDTTNPAVIAVADTTRPHSITALTLNALGPNDIDVKWTTPETDSTDGDSVFVYCATGNYPAPESPGKVTVAAMPVGTAAGERSAVIGGLSPETTYYFAVWLSDTVGNWARADSDTVVTPKTGEPTNPVVVRGSYVDDTHIRLTLSNFCQLPTTAGPFDMWADYVGIWYQSGDFSAAPDTSTVGLLRFDAATLKAAAACPGTASFDTVIEVPPLSAPDSVYYLNAAVRWHNPDSVMPFVEGNGDSVLMRDMTPPENPCAISGIYAGGRSDTVHIAVYGLSAIESKVAVMEVFCSFDSAFGDTFLVRALKMDSLRAAESGDVLRLVARNSAFDGPRRTVYCAVVLVSGTGVVSEVQRGAFDVGRDMPPNPIQLTATTVSSYAVALYWPAAAVAGTDSVRIFRDTVQIPLDVMDVSTAFPVIAVGPGVSLVNVRDLNPSTTYYFAAQARVSGDWTAVSIGSRAVARTFDPDPADTVSNAAVIDTAWFDMSRNRIVVKWHYGSVPDSQIQYGCVYGVDSAAVTAGVPTMWRGATGSDSVVIELGESILFDTTYTIVVKMRRRGGVASAPSRSATASVRVGSCTWQPIVYFRKQVGDTAWAFNGRIALWYEGAWAYGEIADTVRAVPLAGIPRGLLPASGPFMFTCYDDGPPVTLAAGFDSVPAGYSPEDIRLYRRTIEGQWKVFHDYTLDPARRMAIVNVRMVDIEGQRLRLMIDREPPSFQVLSDIDTPVRPLQAVADTLVLSDNIANLSATMFYARAANEPKARRADTLQALSALITTAIPGGYVTEEDGVRAYLVLSDGLHRDTVDISRRVIREHASDITTEPGKWVPLRTNAVLDDNALGTIIEGIVGDQGYDNTYCRVFRWFDPAASTDVSQGLHGWVEYDPAREAVFTVKPGKLMWIKTRDLEYLDFGGGTTVSLREPVTIALPPRNWTDLALPYKFGIRLEDILDATGDVAESLQYYRWIRGGDGTYVTDVIYLPAIPDSALTDRSHVLSSSIQTGYSIYNPLDHVVTLRIPPTAESMSDYKSAEDGLAKAGDRASWVLRVTAQVEDAHPLGTVFLAYAPGRAGVSKSWYPAAPSFGGVTVRARDRSARKAYGHAVAHELKDGGTRFDIVFENTTNEPRLVSWCVNGAMALPDSMAVRVLDPNGGGEWPGDTPMRVQVPAGGEVLRALAVGGPSYFVNAYADVKPFAGFAAYPNPFSGGVAVRFLLPEGVSRLEYRVFDTRGRLVWRQTHTEEIRVGPNVVVWNGRAQSTSATAAATYVLRIRAYDARGSLLAMREQRLMRMK